MPTRPAEGIDTDLPDRPVTQPTRTASSPACLRAARAACWSDLLTTTQNPIPMLTVAYTTAGEISPAVMYATFNMGIGFCVVVSKSDQQAALAALKQAGEDAVRVGWVTGRSGKSVSIPSAGLVGKGDAFEPVR